MPDRWHVAPRRLAPAAAVAALFASLLAVVVAKAWVCDDAYITLRSVDNLLSGYGPNWNAGERVQAYTHPLWMLLLAAVSRLTSEVFYTSIGLGVLLTAVAAWILTRRLAPSAGAAALGLALLAGSRGFTDYATSGLENPLTQALTALYLVVFLELGAEPTGRRTGLLATLAGLLLLTRLDAAFLILPSFAWQAWRARRQVGPLVTGLLPFALWELFALVYYGVPIPNSALAKLGSGLGPAELLPQGGLYLLESLRTDPVTLPACVAAVVLPCARRDAPLAAIGLGIALHLGWVVWVGGDFMSGRFLTAPLFAAAIVLARQAPPPRLAWSAAVAGLAIGVAAAGIGGAPAGAVDAHGIADERGFYAEQASLWSRRGRSPWPDPQAARDAARLQIEWRTDPVLNILVDAGVVAGDETWARPGTAGPAAATQPVVVSAAAGFLGWYLGPGVHLLDIWALGDPLLARLPALRPDPILGIVLPELAGLPWRVGHYTRRIPAGYLATLSTGRNALRDPQLAAAYERIRLITRGPLLAPARLRAIAALATLRLRAPA
jgi:arabinofuranosyltransferase